MADSKKILFVDDEASLLEALKRRLRPLAKEWDMQFAPGGERALELLKNEHFDVIVSDLRMPGVDGVTLLDEVKLQYPHMTRIVLSGQADNEASLRAIGPAHQFLAKPCNPDVLKATINRALSLRRLLNDQKLQEFISGLSYVPSMPSLFTKLCIELKSSHASLQQVGTLIARDAAMTAKILQIINSEFFGLSHKLSNSVDAVNLLGIETIRALVLSVGVFSGKDVPNLPRKFVNDSWNHSLITAVLARQIAIAEGLGMELANQAFTAGLLHDIGRLVLAVHSPSLYVNTMSLEGENPSWEKEVSTLGASHMEVGAYLLGLWGLPDLIVEAVAYHHRPSYRPFAGLVPLSLVHFADYLHSRNCQMAGKGQSPHLDEAYLEQSGMKDHLPDWTTICSVTLEEKLGEDLKNLVLSPE